MILNKVGEAFENIMFKKAWVSKKQYINDSYILFEIRGPELKGINIAFGDFFQISFGGMQVRSYTPVEWDTEKGMVRFVYFCHGEGLAASWFENISEDDECFVYGPRHSLHSQRFEGPLTLIGDETSLGLSLSTKKSSLTKSPENIFLFVNNVEDAVELNWNYSMGAKVLQNSADSLQKVLAVLPPKGTVIVTGGSKLVTFIKKEINKLHSVVKVIGVPYWKELKY